MKEYINLFLSSILAGLCISIGCIINLQIGGVIGAILFTFGLITVVHYKYSLYTGTAGFIDSWKSFLNLIYILIFNIIGCFGTAYLISIAIPDLQDKVITIIQNRESQEIWSAMIRGIFCGFLMTTAVKFGRENKWLPLLWAVPVFILAGFYHSIADAFYIGLSQTQSIQVYYNWGMTIIGNFIGCNLYRLKFIQ